VRRRATSRANSSDNDFSIDKDIGVPSLVRTITLCIGAMF
jgi:hypothetical protein